MHSENGVSPIEATDDGMIIWVSEAHSEKAPDSMDVTKDGIT